MKTFPFLRQRRPFTLTKGGWIFILYTIGVGAGAINTGNNLLYLVFGLFLGLILASGVLSDMTLWRLDAAPIVPERGRVGEPLFVPLEIRNRKSWFPSMGLRIRLRGVVAGQSVVLEGFCPAVPAGGKADCVVVWHPELRGALRLTDVSFTTRFPFGLLSKTWKVPIVTQPAGSPGRTTLILPRRTAVDLSHVFAAAEHFSADRVSARKGQGPSLFGIREFQAADNPRRIHWKASAKRTAGLPAGLSEGWLVREMENEETDLVRLRWPEPFPAVGAKAERFFSAVSSLVEILLARRIAVVLTGAEGEPWAVTDGDVERFLCVVGTPDETMFARRPSAPAASGGMDLSVLFT